MAREATDATKLARDLPKFGEVLRTKRGRVKALGGNEDYICLLYTSPSPRDGLLSRMPSSA